MESLSDLYKCGIYKDKNPTWGEEDSEWKVAQITSMLGSHSVWPETVAEIGCGAGAVIAGIVRSVSSIKKAEGWDISPQAVNMAGKHASEKLKFFNGDMLCSSQRYDLIMCIDVFEHVPDYLGFLSSLRDHAEHFVFHIPLDMHCSAILRDRHLSVRDSVGHLHYFSRATALRTLKDTGYLIVSEQHTFGALAGLSGHRGWKTSLANLMRRIFPDNLSSKLFGGYSLLVLARPTENK